MIMLDRLLALLEGSTSGAAPAAGPEPLQRAAALLLVIAARLDGSMAPIERQSILQALRRLPAVADPIALIDEAEHEAAASTDFYQVTRVINEQVPFDQRATIIEMLWDVALADGIVHDYEANLVRRVAGLLHVSDRDAGEARRRAQARTSG